MPLSRRLPKKGFKNLFRKEIIIVNLASSTASPARSPSMRRPCWQARDPEDGRRDQDPRQGTIEKALTVRVNAISQAAKEKIEPPEGKVEVIGKRISI